MGNKCNSSELMELYARLRAHKGGLRYGEIGQALVGKKISWGQAENLMLAMERAGLLLCEDEQGRVYTYEV